MGTIRKKTEKIEDGFKFEVGAMYENMKGVYEVLSIQNDSMVIRWQDGTEVATPVDLQKRIIDRLAYEKKVQQEEVEKQGRTLKRTKAKRTSDPRGDQRV